MRRLTTLSSFALLTCLTACGSSESPDSSADADIGLAPPVFSTTSSTFVGPLQLTLSTTTPDATILFTEDGQVPTLLNASVYTSAITIDSTREIRARAVKDAEQSVVVSQSYLHIADELENYTSTLPILLIDNFAGGMIPDKGWTTDTQTGAGLVQPERQFGVLHILDRDSTSEQSSVNGVANTSSRIGLRVRGAFSSTWDPQPYSMETWAADSEKDSPTSLLGMPSESDWILYYLHPDYDKTLLYNTFIWELSRKTGRYAPAFRFVEVFVNKDGGELDMSDRQGVYALVEKVKRGPDRVDFEELSADGTTGGWLLAINRMDAEPAAGYPTSNGAMSPQFFHTPGPDRTSQTNANEAGGGDDIPRQYNAYINFESPNGYKISAVQRAAIEEWFVEFETTFFNDAVWLDPAVGYRNFLDTRDFIDYFHLLNLGKQGDGLLLSMFPWVSSGVRNLHMGPMWDFNNGAYEGSATSPSLFRQDRLWYPRLFADPEFRSEFVARWQELRIGPLSNESMSAIVDAQAAEIGADLVQAQGLAPSEWNQRLEAMKSYLSARADWLDANQLVP